MPVVDPRAVDPAVLAHWKPMLRIENTGGGVQEVANAIGSMPFERLVFAEGDSWFDKFTPIPRTGTNLLDALRTPFLTGCVDVAHIGDEVRDMVRGHQALQTSTLFDLFSFDAILLSAGGNDLKNLFTDLFAQKALRLQGKATALSEEDLRRLATPSSFEEFFADVVANIRKFIALRDGAGDARTRKAPLFLHGYDFFQPRPAGAMIFVGSRIGRGPWLYPSMHAAGLTAQEMRSVADAVVDQMNTSLRDAFQALPDVFVIDQRGLLTPAPADSSGESTHWIDEIHPNEAGFALLAENRWNVPVSEALGWVPAAGDLRDPLPLSNESTAFAEGDGRMA